MFSFYPKMEKGPYSVLWFKFKYIHNIVPKKNLIFPNFVVFSILEAVVCEKVYILVADADN